MIRTRAVAALAIVLVVATLPACGSRVSAGGKLVVEGHRWRMLSYARSTSAVRVPAADRTMLTFDRHGKLDISAPSGDYTARYVVSGSGFRVSDYAASGWTMEQKPNRGLRRAVESLIAFSPVHVQSRGPRTVQLATRHYRIICERADGQPMSTPQTGKSSPAEHH